MKTIYKTIAEALEAGKPMVLVTLIEQDGSTPRTAGAKMLVLQEAGIIGTVGGGLYEAKAIALAQELYKTHNAEVAMKQGTGQAERALVVLFDLRGSATPTDMDMICGGALRLLIEYIPATQDNIDLYRVITEAESAGEACTIITRIGLQTDTVAQIAASKEAQYAVEPDTSLCFLNTGSTPACALHIPDEVKIFAEKIDHHTAHSYLHAGHEYILEALHTPYRIHIFGAGHVSCELAKIADYLAFTVTAIDDRAEFASAERFPNAMPLVLDTLEYAQIVDYFAAQNIGAHDGVVIVTRGHARDRDVLAAAIETQAGYIGMIGSKTKRQATYAHLVQAGYDEASFNRVHSPIGLSIGAQTPEEIAISISAELIQWRVGRL